MGSNHTFRPPLVRYGKESVKAGRKMGHITFTGDCMTEVLAAASAVGLVNEPSDKVGATCFSLCMDHTPSHWRLHEYMPMYLCIYIYAYESVPQPIFVYIYKSLPCRVSHL